MGHVRTSLLALAFLVASCGPQAADTTAADAVASREPVASAPDLTLRTLDGGTFTLSEHLGELPIVLNFWAPW